VDSDESDVMVEDIYRQSWDLSGMSHESNAEQWDQQYAKHGHTGYGEQTLYRYDQPLRLRAFNRALQRLPDDPEHKNALDIGCGTGDIIRLLRALNYTVYANDISPDVARDTAQRFAGDEGVTVNAAAIENLSLEPSSIDLVTSGTVLQHIHSGEPIEMALRALRSALRPDGRLVALEIAPLRTTSYISSGVTERVDLEWRAIFEASGFSIESVREYSPWGPLALHNFDRLVGRVIRVTGSPAPGPESAADSITLRAVQRRGVLRRILSSVFKLCRLVLLWGAWPLDRVLRVPGPRRAAYYRIYTLRPVDK
jgi:SAM-dependent methyltransferase